MATVVPCPPNPSWTNQVEAGYSRDTAAWINADKQACYVNPYAGAGLSKVHTFMRQLRYIIVTLREKLGIINEEIKLVQKVKEGIARSLDDLSIALRVNKKSLVFHRPRFIKNHAREATVELWQKNCDQVHLNRSEMLVAQHKLRRQYWVAKAEWQKLDRVRTQMATAVKERTRILEVFPDLVANTTKTRRYLEEHRTMKKHQNKMLKEITAREGYNKNRYFRNKLKAVVAEEKEEEEENKEIQSKKQPKPSYSFVDFRNQMIKSPVRKVTPQPTEGIVPNAEVQKEIKSRLIIPTSLPRPPSQLCVCDDTTYIPAMTMACHRAMQAVTDAVVYSRDLRKRIAAIVEDAFLVRPTVGPPPEEESDFGKFYGVACGGKSPRKKAILTC